METVDRYRKCGFPAHTGLLASSAIVSVGDLPFKGIYLRVSAHTADIFMNVRSFFQGNFVLFLSVNKDDACGSEWEEHKVTLFSD